MAHAAKNFTEIPLIGFGAMGISEFYGTTNEKEALQAISTAIDQGINHFDTADGYAFGDNERFLRKALSLQQENNRKSLIVASKAGILRDKNDPSVRGICIKPDYLQGQLDQSLDNLGTDYLDIFYIHRLPPKASSEELDALATFLAQIKSRGLARAVGISEPSRVQLEYIHQRTPISFVQSEYSLLERTMGKNGVLEFCRQQDISFVAYSPLCRGMLTDNFSVGALEDNDFRKTLPKFSQGNLQHNIILVEKLKNISAASHISLACFSLAWLITQDIVVIPGMRKSSRVLDAVESLMVEFNQEELTEINKIAYLNATNGMRYSQAAMDAYGFK